jgi:L-fuconolactonase
MKLVDSQIHMFAPGAEAFAQRMQQILVPPAQLLEEMDAAGVARAYLVPGNGDANATCVEAVRRWPDRFRAMGILGLDKPESREKMKNWEQSGLHGVRLTFPPYRKVSWLKDGTADWFWPEAARLRLPVMIWAPEQIDAVDAIAAAYPDIRFVIDHMNLFVEDKGGTIDRAVAALLPLAARPNVAVKVSALAAHSSQDFPFRDMQPHVQAVVGAFGAGRTFWGTDITRRSCTYQQAIEMFTTHMPFLQGKDLEQVMGGAITDWVGW